VEEALNFSHISNFPTFCVKMYLNTFLSLVTLSIFLFLYPSILASFLIIFFPYYIFFCTPLSPLSLLLFVFFSSLSSFLIFNFFSLSAFNFSLLLSLYIIYSVFSLLYLFISFPFLCLSLQSHSFFPLFSSSPSLSFFCSRMLNKRGC
jgi:hypothetical protein